MAPLQRQRDDDFVLTLSDREENDDVSSVGEESAEEQTSSRVVQKENGKKRKRGAVQQPQTNGKKKIRTSRQDQVGGEDEDDDVDAVMDPSFEFEVGAGIGIVEEGFDAWGAGTNIAAQIDQPQKKGNKKGVDIDEVVERRRMKQAAKEAKNRRKQQDSEEEFDGVNSDEESPAIDEEGDLDGEDIIDFGGDELLAADAFGGGADSDEQSEVESENDGNEDGSEDDGDSDPEASDDDSVASPVAHPDDVGSGSDSDAESVDSVEDARQKAFFAPEAEASTKSSISETTASFQSFSLSRPILRGVASIGFTTPTPIQAKTIPVALQGKDVVGGAQTGSGKTAAFVLPILERLLYRPRNVPTSRVAILMPTRELAVQCFNVATKLASFTDITFCQLVGGFSLREQENVLKKRPDVIIATPGRFIDHMRNSASFTVDTLEILVLDEADRMLEDGFADELNEIFKTIPRSRQTMLFSATMTNDVDRLIRAGLNRPLRIMVDAKRSTVAGLVQEFVRLRPGREDKRLAVLMLLCTQVYTGRVIIFFRTKKDAHRVRVVFALCGLKAAELHGSMTQEQRLSAVEAFRTSKTPFLLATDLASRGLDIKNVTTVLNYSAPQSLEIYLHRVGRTARAGTTGRACTIAAEDDRKVVKSAVKMGRTQGAKIVSRIVDTDEVDTWAKRLENLEDEIEAVLKEEKEEKALSTAEMQVTKGENLMKYQDEIMARPKRTWFESEQDKKVAKAAGRAQLNGVATPAPKNQETKKLSNKEKKQLDDRKERMGGKMWKKGKGDAVALVKGKNGGSKTKGKEKGGVKGKGKGRGKPRRQ